MRTTLIVLACMSLALAACDAASPADDAGSSAGDAGDGLSSCDPREVTCDGIEPTCPAFYVPAVEGGCWGPCVPHVDCRRPIACDEAAGGVQCPTGWGCAAGECAPPR